ncbi:hypothetical protein JF546_19115 [Nitratireductor aquimarinus]|uniref:hypothetical protein n=1 Tax=Nitratireductor TaxID=245876 RepID=UPI0019D37BF8|nr:MULTISPECIES: hypothetical protein [Nitratireductor]MBN7759764.1 hypothetical protein [Nitratireductor aquibiodomus]MBN8245133.1 hypothetical protein [Nitratireductor aquimarinus]MBY6133518.1 hypothetical protein [Nitratireductor aquimarinus]MCA1304831.1 hypothetical protein [Nitratireductor aquimarinus]MCV0350210.1 hypothetical protein [Nitratireductor sp.]
MRILPVLDQKPVRRHFASHVVIQREDYTPPQTPHSVEHRSWNSLSFSRLRGCSAPEREALERVSARPSRQHQAPVRRNVMRLYRPQDQRGVRTVFVIMDRVTGQVLARVRGDAAHCEIEAEKLARSQGCQLADLKVIFEGELS